MDSIFLRHTYKDTERAELIERALLDFPVKLHQIPSLQVWRTGNPPVGISWQDETQRRLWAATAFVPLITASYLSSVNATVELGRILEIRARRNAPLIPIICEPVKLADTPASQFTGFTLPAEIGIQPFEIEHICSGIDRALHRWHAAEFPFGMGELYLSYRMLEPKILSGILESMTKLYHLVYRIAADVPDHVTDRALFSQSPQDRLQIDAAETGESIKLKLKTGWLPSFDVEDGDLVVEIPRGALSLAATMVIVSTAIDSGTGSVKNVLDIVQGRYEVRIQLLQEEKLQLELKRLRAKIAEADENTAKKIDKELRALFRLTVQNDDIFSVKLSAGGDGGGE